MANYYHGEDAHFMAVMDARILDFASLGVNLERQINELGNLDLFLTDKKRGNNTKMAGRENIDKDQAFKLLNFAKTALNYSK